MALLPEKIRYKLFDSLSLKTKCYVDSVSSRDVGMLVSLVHTGDRAGEAKQILDVNEDAIDGPVLRARLQWVRTVATPGSASTITAFDPWYPEPYRTDTGDES